MASLADYSSSTHLKVVHPHLGWYETGIHGGYYVHRTRAGKLLHLYCKRREAAVKANRQRSSFRCSFVSRCNLLQFFFLQTQRLLNKYTLTCLQAFQNHRCMKIMASSNNYLIHLSVIKNLMIIRSGTFCAHLPGYHFCGKASGTGNIFHLCSGFLQIGDNCTRGIVARPNDTNLSASGRYANIINGNNPGFVLFFREFQDGSYIAPLTHVAIYLHVILQVNNLTNQGINIQASISYAHQD